MFVGFGSVVVGFAILTQVHATFTLNLPQKYLQKTNNLQFSIKV
jgi:hypothetical protein